MDEIDIAQAREQLIIDKALEAHKNNRNRDREMRNKAEAAGIVLHCRYCNSQLEGYDSHYCPKDVEFNYSCAEEHAKERKAMERNGNV